MTRCRTPGHAGDWLRPGKHHVLQVFAHRLGIAQVVGVLHQAVEQRLLGRAPHLADLKRPELAKGQAQRRLIDAHRCGLGAFCAARK